jgi:nucleotide-binding universal stress UspA family protein
MAPRRIFAGISGSPGSVYALRQAAGLARRHDAPLIAVHAWLPPDSRRLPRPEVRQLWEDDAWKRLRDTLDRAFGRLPAGIITQLAVLRGKLGKVLTVLARQPGDLLVIGAGRPGPLRLLAAGSAGTAWPTPAARYWPSRPRSWPGRQAMACAAGPGATACTWTPPRPPEPRSQPEPETAKAYVSNTLRNRRSRTFGEIRTYPGRAGSAVLAVGHSRICAGQQASGGLRVDQN